MKILISTLLLAIVIFLHFGELHAVEGEESSPEFSRKRGRPSGRGSTRDEDGEIHGKFRLAAKFRKKPVVPKRESDGYVEHMGQHIQVWVDDGRIVQAEYPNNNCPTGTTYGKVNYLLRMVILTGGARIVECLDEHGKLLGVRPWIYTNANVMEPNDTQWFFVYSGKIFRVRINPDTKAVMSITLAANNGNEVAHGEKCEKYDIAGLKFVVIREGPNRVIAGAEPFREPPSPKVEHNVRDPISGIKPK